MKRKVCSREGAGGESSHCLFQSVDWRGAGSREWIYSESPQAAGLSAGSAVLELRGSSGKQRMEDGVEWLRSRVTCQERWGKAGAEMKHLSPKHWA